MLDVGKRVGSYELVARLKAGGMATMFLGRRVGPAGFARPVAIKVVHPHLATDTAFVRMFLDEAKLCAQIHHPNVVHVEELGEADGTYFLVMEYVHGCSLSQLRRELAERKRRLSPELAVFLAMRVADGLHAAHEATGPDGPLGVVHRDVSPQNVLLAYTGYVKLIDFGIAKSRGRAQQTTTRSLKGKIRYMAPEQAFGHEVDRRTDVYALGVVLWEMLTMRRLFDAADDFALLDVVRAPKTVAPSTFAPEVPPALDRAVLRALSPNMADRPPTAFAFRAELAQAVPGALAIDSPDVSNLLVAVMADEIAASASYLPESVSAVASAESKSGRSVATLTAPPRKSEPPTALTLEASDIDIDVDGEESDSAPDLAMPTIATPSRVDRARPSRGRWAILAGGAVVLAGGAWLASSFASAPPIEPAAAHDMPEDEVSVAGVAAPADPPAVSPSVTLDSGVPDASAVATRAEAEEETSDPTPERRRGARMVETRRTMMAPTPALASDAPEMGTGVGSDVPHISTVEVFD